MRKDRGSNFVQLFQVLVAVLSSFSRFSQQQGVPEHRRERRPQVFRHAGEVHEVGSGWRKAERARNKLPPVFALLLFAVVQEAGDASQSEEDGEDASESQLQLDARVTERRGNRVPTQRWVRLQGSKGAEWTWRDEERRVQGRKARGARVVGGLKLSRKAGAARRATYNETTPS